MLLTKLKETTQPAHRRLHQIVDLDRLQNSKSDYIACLLGFYQAIFPLEQFLKSLTAVSSIKLPPLFVQRNCKSDWLREDLRHFGIHCIPNSILGEPVKDQDSFFCCDPDRLDRQSQRDFAQQAMNSRKLSKEFPWLEQNKPLDFSSAVGIQYVLEGMTLGLSRIYPRVCHSHRIETATGARFFFGYGDAEAAGARWATFCQWLRTCQTHEEDSIQAAVRTFDWFAATLSFWCPSLERTT